MNRKHAGAHNELLATIWLLKQGYEVFRNMSAHGDVDIIAMKDGGIALFDVKGTNFRTNGEPGRVRLKESQLALGVKVLNVFPDGTCSIDWKPEAIRPTGTRACGECGKTFLFMASAHRRFCTHDCYRAHWVRRKRQKLGIRAIS